MFNLLGYKLKLLILISYILTVLIVNFLFFIATNNDGHEKLEWVQHTNKVIIEVQIFLNALKDTETGQRGYIITKDKTYLEPYYAGLINAKDSFVKLSNFTSDNHSQVNRLTKINKLMKLKFDELKETIDAKEHSIAIGIIKKNHGKEYMDNIRTIILEFIAEEENLLKKRTEELKEDSAKTLWIIRVILSLLLLVLFYFLYKNLNQRQKIVNLEKNKELDKELKEQKKALDEHSIVAITDIKGTITYVNDKFIKISGYSEKELIGRNHRVLNSGVHKTSFWKAMYKTLKKQKTWKYEICNKAKDGSLYWVDSTIVPILDKNNNTKNYIVIRTDITPRKTHEKELLEAKEKAIKAANSKSEFLANMSHEIRTPLNAIHGFIDIIKKETKEEKTLRYINIINSSSKNLLQIIEDILDFSKIESGKLEIENLDFNTKESLGIIVYLFEAKCSQKNITLSLHYKEGLPDHINSDPLRIKQVISNLLSNAIKFTEPNKHIDITIGFKNMYLSVSVKDEGKGIGKDKLKHIFEAFGQEDTSTTREFGGTGLGLSISSKLVQLLGGELKVKSKLGVGSEFYFDIPVTIGTNVDNIEMIKEQVNLSGKKVLLVEDNKTNQLFMSVVFEDMEIEFDLASDGREAIDAFQTSQYDVILMDENMPNMSGIEATKEILKIEKERNLIHTPIIALTANALKGDREKFLSAGMDEYLTKPIEQSKLNKILGDFLV